ncbi:FliA/WhiG family RNA polymerase sigma factor [Sporosarcina thermotolerans]|uniref:FliA/WhiG family RNA polymerase sigma factor n=1 Tax=Sporosarcina thermotolerans TaxID=633404 RepID=A0AAW9A4M5_9BACL|nr:FliA/WhiG family RNA polymerase sigma factor [Sporosarcina thermotolerans]MDW0115709.1 FliA/WhiG family RNA polymerase sigma factor [Sporosarcina thermotolerans]WHT47031.1 FliA/WhiG family RNA polymerase sigma factor [Sporosarcina thermotolerans]
MSKQNLTDEDIIWIQWLKKRDSDAGDVLVRKYTPLVNYHVQRISSGLPRNVSRDDIVSLGLQGLFDALTKFDPNRDLKFDTYASFRIRGSIIDGLRKEDWMPRLAREKSKKLENEISKLEQKLLRHATPEEIADHLGIEVDDVYQTLHEHYFSNVLSMEERVGSDDEEGNSYTLQDHHEPTPEHHVMMGELVQDLTMKIKELNANEQMVLDLFYTNEMTLTEIGEILGLSTSRISQIHSKALFKLRKSLLPEIVDGGIL